MRLWKQLPVTIVAGILDSVRSKALEFVLEIEAANPDAGATTTANPRIATRSLGDAEGLVNDVWPKLAVADQSEEEPEAA